MKSFLLIAAFVIAYGIVGFSPRKPGEWTPEKDGNGFHQGSSFGTSSRAQAQAQVQPQDSEAVNPALFERENAGFAQGNS